MTDHRITLLLERLRDGEQAVWPELVAAIDTLLRPMALGRLAADRRGATWDPSDLVQTAIEKMLRAGVFKEALSRGPIIAGAALVMQHLLIDRARKRRSAKTAGYGERVPLDEVIDRLAVDHQLDLLSLDEAMAKLKRKDERQYEIVMLRFFGGQSFPAIAQFLGMSLSAVEKAWYGEIKPWLFIMLS